ncbi:oxidoreductase [Ferviditalea candida]|uniref:FAD-dependent oxidoreductase n=1 Tax=Ferviditalea candida TaxID=3108399 RepID=A0ABU5ZEP7_9BACL|nr:FAD-dependent oxidoreductase [Paenibacillaceae bacterium T2]
MSKLYPHLFSEGRIGPVALKNRVILPALTSNFASETGEVTDQLIEFHRARAQGNAGLICVEGAFVHWSGKGTPKQLGLYKDELIPGFRKLTDSVHAYGVPVMLQLVHSGRQMTSKFSNMQPVAPSAIACPVTQEMPRALSTEEIEEMVESFALAAKRARAAGFDLVEFHAGHGYLISNFLSPDANKRGDRYGGNAENRFRFLKEIILHTWGLTGRDFPIVVRMNAADFTPEGLTIGQSQQYALWLQELGVAAISISMSVRSTYYRLSATSGVPDAYQTPYAEQFARILNIPVISAGKIVTPTVAEEVLAGERANFVAMGRALIADPHLVRKTIEGRESDIIPCISCNACNQRTRRPQIICLTNGDTSREGTAHYNPTDKPKRVVVAGSGIAGLEYARVAARRGHQVTVMDEKDKWGRLLGLARTRVPGQTEFSKAVAYFNRELERLNVDFAYVEKLSPERVQQLHPDVAVVAAGNMFRAKHPSEVGAALAHEILYAYPDQPAEDGKPIVVIGGGVLGAETALYLKKRHAESPVTILEPGPSIIYDAHPTVRFFLEERLLEAGVDIRTDVENLRYDGNSASGIFHNQQLSYEGCRVIAESALDEWPQQDTAGQLSWNQTAPTVQILGDAYEASDLAERVWKAGEWAREL